MPPFTRRCSRCHSYRDADELFAGKSTACLLCENRKASFAAKAERTAQRIKANQKRAAERRGALSEAERYRRALHRDSPYSDDQIAAYVAARFPDEVSAT